MNHNNDTYYLAELIMDVVPKAMQSLRFDLRKGQGDRLTIPQFRILAAINRGICYNKELGDHLGVSEAAISRMIHFLVNDGLIEKGINEIDRRQTFLKLTKEGQKFYDSAKSNARISLKNKLENLSNEELESVIGGLKILKNSLFNNQ